MRKISEPIEGHVPDRCREALYNEMMTALGRIAEEHMHLPAFQFFIRFFSKIIPANIIRILGAKNVLIK